MANITITDYVNLINKFGYMPDQTCKTYYLKAWKYFAKKILDMPGTLEQTATTLYHSRKPIQIEHQCALADVMYFVLTDRSFDTIYSYVQQLIRYHEFSLNFMHLMQKTSHNPDSGYACLAKQVLFDLNIRLIRDSVDLNPFLNQLPNAIEKSGYDLEDGVWRFLTDHWADYASTDATAFRANLEYDKTVAILLTTNSADFIRKVVVSYTSGDNNHHLAENALKELTSLRLKTQSGLVDSTDQLVNQLGFNEASLEAELTDYWIINN